MKHVRATLAAERTRVEALMAVERTWPFAEWRRYYRDHPVTSVVACGLIWEFEGRTASGTRLPPARACW